MATFDVFNMKREKVGSIDLADEVFGAEVQGAPLLRGRQGAARVASGKAPSAAKNRSAVSGSTKKLYKQKGTGRARHGSIRAPIYVGGGKAHPPRPRDWSYEPPRRVRAQALTSALSKFGKEGRLLVVDRFELAEIKTKSLLEALGDAQGPEARRSSSTRGDNEKLKLSIRNCKSHQFLPPEGLNVYDLLRHDTLILSKDAAKELEERCLKQSASRSDRARRRRCAMTPEQIIRRPIILTEKATLLREKHNQVVFEVARDANKVQIRDAVQKLFKVNVTGVNTMIMRGKERRMGRGYAKTQNWKKAIVTLKEGDSIDFFADASE